QPTKPAGNAQPPIILLPPQTPPPTSTPNVACPCGDCRGELAAMRMKVNELEKSISAFVGTVGKQAAVNRDELARLRTETAAALNERPAGGGTTVVRADAEALKADTGLRNWVREIARQQIADHYPGVWGQTAAFGLSIGGPIGLGLLGVAAAVGLVKRRRARRAAAGDQGAPADDPF
ncbi:MAG: hypothetical protein KDA41_20290, partial [Planctomycetales bacterium]|nr:hypothetical protein [Planctomycetales bacterium]